MTRRVVTWGALLPGRVCATLLALVCMCGLLLVGCAGDDPADPSLRGWERFEWKSVSLMLPDSFVGGDPFVPEVMTALMERHASIPNPSDSSESQLFFSGLSGLQQSDLDVWSPYRPLLFAWGEPDAQGLLPEVTVRRIGVEKLRGFARGDNSMGALAEFMIGLSMGTESEWTVQVLSPTRAYMRYRQTASEGNLSPFRIQKVLQVAGQYLYEFTYTHNQESNDALDAAFATSAETAGVEGFR